MSDQFAIVPLPPPGQERERLTAGAIMVGDMATVTEPILSSLAREATEQLLNDTAEAIEEEHRLARKREREESAARADAIQKLCDGIARMAKRFDALEKQRREDAREARRKARKQIEDNLPDPDLPDPATGEPVAIEPWDKGAYEYFPDDSPTGTLPPGVERPAETGELAVWNRKELAKPQKPIPQTPTAVGGS